MFRLIYALEKRLTRAHEFINNVVFYLGRVHACATPSAWRK